MNTKFDFHASFFAKKRSGLFLSISFVLAAVLLGSAVLFWQIQQDSAVSALAQVEAAAAGDISTVAGNGTGGFSGDTGAATSAQIDAPNNVYVDSSGNLFIADYFNNRIRKVTASTGVITTFAGTGVAGSLGDGGAATSAQLNAPTGVVGDNSGNIYIAENNGHRVRKVNTSGTISTFAGTGSAGYTGDTGLATAAQLSGPADLSVDSAGNVYIAEYGNSVIRKVAAGTGIISTVAGNGSGGFSGDGSAATSAQLSGVIGVDVDLDGNIYIVDNLNFRIRKVNGVGVISTVAGTGASSFTGDDGLATSATFSNMYDVATDVLGNFYITDRGNGRVRKVTVATGIVTTVAGNGSGYSGDGGPATSAGVDPVGVYVDTAGNIFIGDNASDRIRKVEAATVAIPAFSLKFGSSGSGSGQFSGPEDVVTDSTGNIFVVDTNNQRIQKFNSAGTFLLAWGSLGTGDGQFQYPDGIAIDASDNIYVADGGNHRIQKFSSIGTFLLKWGKNGGDGTLGAADGEFYGPSDVEVDRLGNVYVSDRLNSRVQKFTSLGVFTSKFSVSSPVDIAVDSNGDIYTVNFNEFVVRKFNNAGTALLTWGSSGTGNGQLNGAIAVDIDALDMVYVADRFNHRIQKFDYLGNFVSKAGKNGGDGTSGSANGEFSSPRGIHIDSDGVVYVADNGNARVQLFDPAVIPNAAPTAPTTLYVNDTTAQTGAANPLEISDTTPAFSAICNDPDVGDILNKYQVQVDNDSNFSSVIWDSGATGTSMANCTSGSRSADIVFGGTPLALDGTLYYWRIKFWDDDNAEGVFSETISTNTFTMALPPASIQRIQQANLPASPTSQDGEAIGSDTIRWNFVDNAANEIGFRLIDEGGAMLVEIAETDQTRIDEAGLLANTEYAGRAVKAYNDNGESTPSEAFEPVVTAMPALQAVVVSNEDDTLIVGVSASVPNLTIGDSALIFELLSAADAVQSSAVLSSGWVQAETYAFTGLAVGEQYQARVKSRNQVGSESAWSSFTSPVSIIEQDVMLPAFSVQLGLSQSGKTISSNDLVDPREDLSVGVDVNNFGDAQGTNVFLHIPLPEHVFLVESSLQIDGSTQTSAADVDDGQGSAYAVSAIWDQLDPGQSRHVAFMLRFDQEALRAIESQPVASSNPFFSLQASVGSTEITEPVYSTPITVEADLAVFAPVVDAEPVEEPVEPEPPVLLPTEEETVIINEILEEAFTPGIEPVNAPAQTTSSYDGGSFSISVSNGTDLTVTGFAQTHDDQIEFTGTTSEPFTLVTLIFNDSITSIVVSDANGNWRTFVSAESLGVLPGQEQSVKIEAIAAKGDLRSERVVVGKIQLTRAMSGQVIADFETIVSSSSFATTINEFRKQAVQSLTEQEPILQTTLTAAAPIIVISSVPLWGYLPYAPVLIQHLFVWFLGLIGRRKGRGQANTFGVVYDSITKQPLALAIVRVYQSGEGAGKLLSTTVTDQQGRYDVLLPPGSYRLSVSKPRYSFPSQIVTAADDGGFDRVYQEERGMSVQKESVFAPHIPLDPFNTRRNWQLASVLRKSLLSVQRFGEHLAAPLLLAGFLFSLLLAYAVFNSTNVVIACVYFLLFAAQLKLRHKLEKAWGVVFEIATNAVLPLTAIQLIDPAYGKVVASRLSDYEGRFSFLPQPGDYVVKASKPGYEQVQEVIDSPQVNRRMLTGQIRIDKPGQRISGDVAMKTSI